MTSLATVSSGLPVPSQALAEVLFDARRNVTTAAEPLPLAAPASVRQEAGRLADSIEEALRPADRAGVQKWLLELSILTAKAPDDIESAAGLMARFLADLPAICFTYRSLERAASAFKYWPEYRDLKMHLAEIATPVRAEIAGLRAVQAASEVAPREGDRPDPVRARQQVEDLKAELAARREAMELRGGVKPHGPKRHSPELLAALYRKQVAEGGPRADAAATRLRALEKQARVAEEAR
jgi:hypothetical protein